MTEHIEAEIENEMEASLELRKGYNHPLHELSADDGTFSMGTGFTSNACGICSPSSSTRCSTTC